MKHQNETLQKKLKQVPTNWASTQGTMHFATNHNAFKRSASAKNLKTIGYVSPSIQPQFLGQRKGSKGTNRKGKSRSRIANQMRKEATITEEIYRNLLDDIGYQPLHNQFSDEFNLTRKRNTDSKAAKGPKEAVGTIELQRKIQKLDRKIQGQHQENKSLKQKIYQLHGALNDTQANQAVDVSQSQDALAISRTVASVPCCCQELQEIQKGKEEHLLRLSDGWRQKAQKLAAEYEPKINKLKSQQVNLYQSAHFEIKQMKHYMENIIQNILKKQQDIVNIYQARLNGEKKENKALVKRLIQ